LLLAKDFARCSEAKAEAKAEAVTDRGGLEDRWFATVISSEVLTGSERLDGGAAAIETCCSLLPRDDASSKFAGYSLRCLSMLIGADTADDNPQ
jgi:hypothetical protein